MHDKKGITGKIATGFPGDDFSIQTLCISHSKRILIYYYFNFFTAGIVTVLRQWLYDGCPETPGEIAEIINSILPQAPEKLLVFQEPLQ